MAGYPSQVIDDAEQGLRPDQADRLRTYASEAAFFDGLLSRQLATLPTGARILEVGSGIGLLSMMIANHGYAVTAVEPQSGGFAEMRQLRERILDHWTGPVPKVEWVDGRVGDLDDDLLGTFDLVVAINVVEHVESVGSFIAESAAMAAPGRVFRFVCPNYAIPYEPHFNMPTLFSKALTERVLGDRIRSTDLLEPEELWAELSWPTVHSLRREMAQRGLAYRFSSEATQAYISRALDDPTFAERKGPLLTTVGDLLARVPEALYRSLPRTLLPIIDCQVAIPPGARG